MRQRSARRLGLTVVLATLLVSGQSAADPAAAPTRPGVNAAAAHRMEPGDVLEINVVGTADLKQRVVVGLDGDVQLNLAGSVPAAGLTLQELRGQICTALSRKVLKQRTLEASNTDISSEFSKMIVTQQAYSANTKVMSTAQQMLSDIINIIR